jgi:hypothetical protein
MIGMPVGKLVTAVATLLLAGAGIALAAPNASADTLNCLANVTAVQNLNNEAISYDQSGNTSAAASEDSGVTFYQNQVGPNCYFNPSVPYGAYSDAITGYGYVSAAQSANSAGNAALALQDEQTAAPYLSASIVLLENSRTP